jgi:hypothetical protein
VLSDPYAEVTAEATMTTADDTSTAD